MWMDEHQFHTLNIIIFVTVASPIKFIFLNGTLWPLNEPPDRDQTVPDSYHLQLSAATPPCGQLSGLHTYGTMWQTTVVRYNSDLTL
jgi:hypothetical protein